MARYRRILLKLSGEALAIDDHNIDPQKLNRVFNSMLDDSKTLANILSGKPLGTTVSQRGD